jgi:hypothetical protein
MVTMRGPAEEVFRGELDLGALVARHAARVGGAVASGERR